MLLKQEFPSLCLAFLLAPCLAGQSLTIPWRGYGHDSQHSGLSSFAAQPLNRIKWSTPVDLVLATTPGDLNIHYGSPLVTAANTVIVPVRTNDSNVFRIDVRDGADGSLKYTLTTDYSPPPNDWIPSYSPVLSGAGRLYSASAEVHYQDQPDSPAGPGGQIAPYSNALSSAKERTFSRSPTTSMPVAGDRLYYAGAGGTVYYRDQPDSATGHGGQIAFYGNALYSENQAAFNQNVMVSTPITADRYGNIFFGFTVLGPNPANLTGGIAKIAYDGVTSWVSASAAAGQDPSITEVPWDCAPALSNDQLTLYFAVSTRAYGTGYLVSVDSRTLAPIARASLIDPEFGIRAILPDNGSASPTVGPDGDVYFGVLEAGWCCTNDDRGWLLHFDKALAQTKIPGAFGWDTTASIVPSGLVPSYHGKSGYLLFTKYNNYAGYAPSGDGRNKVAVLDPGASMIDPVTGATVMQEVITMLGPTLDPTTNAPGAVHEWCVNSAAIDPFTKSAIVNSEDGVVYRWDLTTNTFTQSLRLTPGVGEAYTPTVIGVDGTAYAINDAVLFAVGQ